MSIQTPEHRTPSGRLGEMIRTMKGMLLLKTSRKSNADNDARRSHVPEHGHSSNQTPPASSRRSRESQGRKPRAFESDEKSESTKGTSTTVSSQARFENGTFGPLTSIKENEVLEKFEQTRHAKGFSGDTSRARNIQRRKIRSPHIVIKDHHSWLDGHEPPGHQVESHGMTPPNPTSLLPNKYIAGL